jgi:hypothetical protein
VGHTEELSEARTDVVEVLHHVRVQDLSSLKASSKHFQSMADHLVVAVVDLLPVVDKQTANPRRTRTRFLTGVMLVAISEAALQTSFPVAEEASRAAVASPLLITPTLPKALFPTTRTSNRGTTRMCRHQLI